MPILLHMRTLTVSLLAALAILLAGCGGAGENESTPAPAESTTSAPTPAAATSSSTPAYVENATCRKRMAVFLDVTDSFRVDSLSFHVYHRKVDGLYQIVDRAVVACSSHVERPVRRAMFMMAAIDLAWDVCESQTCVGGIEEQFATVNETLDRAYVRVQRTY